jgi:hypothetical protein
MLFLKIQISRWQRKSAKLHSPPTPSWHATPSGLSAGLPDFSCYNIPKREQNIPNGQQNGCEIYQTDIKYTNIIHCKTLQNLPKIWNFGLKIYHLATPLVSSVARITSSSLFRQ